MLWGYALTEVTEFQIALASKLPLLDAAYSLWRHATSPSPSGGWSHTIDTSDYVAFANTFPNAHVGQVGRALHWLKRAHPDTDDNALQNAVRAAVKFDQDCRRFFAYNSKDYIEDVTVAVNLASKENPGFTEPTLTSAHTRLCIENR
jgi:hypothetical protein